MNTLAYQQVCKNIDSKATLVVVSKTRSVQEIMHYYHLGVRDFGENRVDELLEKVALCPKDIRWHFIGHLQRNKAKKIISYVFMIHSIDNLELLSIINKESKKLQSHTNVLLQFNIAKEPQKYGFQLEDANDIIEQSKQFDAITYCGTMVMAPYLEDSALLHPVFENAAKLHNQLKNHFSDDYSILSMGMSNDYLIALEHGSTMIRIGSLLF